MPCRPLLVIVGALALAAAGTLPTVALAAAEGRDAEPAAVRPVSEQLLLDAAAGGDDALPRAAVRTSRALPANAFAVVEVSGTFSRWSARTWLERGRCGSPEPSPQRPSPGVAAQGLVGEDAEVEFAQSYACVAQDAPLPRNLGSLRIDAGSGFSRYVAREGSLSSASQAHAYSYVVPGQGSRLGFRIQDVYAADNYGQLALLVRPAVPDDCEEGGWRDFTPFLDEAQCTTEFQGGRRATAPGGTLRITVLPSAVLSGDSATLRGYVGGLSAPVTTLRVHLQVRTAGKWRRYATTRPSAAGRVAFRPRAAVSAQWRLQVAGRPVASAARTLRARAVVRVEDIRSLTGGVVRFAGTVRPALPGIRVQVLSGGRLLVQGRTAKQGSFAFRVRRADIGTAVVVVPAGTRYLRGAAKVRR